MAEPPSQAVAVSVTESDSESLAGYIMIKLVEATWIMTARLAEVRKALSHLTWVHLALQAAATRAAGHKVPIHRRPGVQARHLPRAAAN